MQGAWKTIIPELKSFTVLLMRKKFTLKTTIIFTHTYKEGKVIENK